MTQEHDAETVERVARAIHQAADPFNLSDALSWVDYAPEASAAIAAMPPREVTGWQPIETAPDDGICKDIWVKGLGRIPNVHMHSAYHDATHWMPRPAAPEAK